MIDGHVPTPQDIIKYASQGARLLVAMDCYATPLEITIGKVVNGGEYFGTFGGFFSGVGWYRTADVRVIAILPPPMPEPETWPPKPKKKKPYRYPKNMGNTKRDPRK